MLTLDIGQFIKKHITFRDESLFESDIRTNRDKLSDAIEGKNVMVIGGAGTIGSSYIKSLIAYRPAKLYVVDTNENGLTELVRDLRSSIGYSIPDIFKTYPINFGDHIFENLFLKEGPWQIVANFAAHKHVRSEKDKYSIYAMLDNNLFRADKLLTLLSENPPEHFFCVSTDKAANPVNVMGASKKLMENLILAYSDKFKINSARFANVAFSNGSLLAGYLERIMKGQPLSCPADIRRFFVSPEESGEICLLATILGKSGQIFFPKLDLENDQIYFKDITLRFIEALGFRPDICRSEREAIDKSVNRVDNLYSVYFFESDTSGEKPYEEFYTDCEDLDLMTFNSLGVINISNNLTAEQIKSQLNELEQVMKNDSTTKEHIVSLLKKFIPDFQHTETGINLDSKM